MENTASVSKEMTETDIDFLNEPYKKSMLECREFPQIDLRKSVPIFSQFVFPNPQVACARACQFILGIFFSDPRAGSKGHRVIVARSDSQLALKILPAAREGVAYIDQQLEIGHPIMVGVNHTLHKIMNGTVVRKGQPDGEDADHFVVIVGKNYDYARKQFFYFYYQVGRGAAHEEEATSTDNRLYLNESDYSLTGESWNGKTYTVTDIRIN